MAEIENFVVAEKGGEGEFVLKFNPVLTDFIKELSLIYNLTEKEVVETFVAAGASEAYREKEGKLLLVLDQNGPDKSIHLFKKNST